MGNTETKLDFRKSVIDLTAKNSHLDETTFWSQFWPQTISNSSANDLFSLITAADVRSLRDNSPNNLSTLFYKSIRYLMKQRDLMCPQIEHKKVKNIEFWNYFSI